MVRISVLAASAKRNVLTSIHAGFTYLQLKLPGKSQRKLERTGRLRVGIRVADLHGLDVLRCGGVVTLPGLGTKAGR